MKVIRAGLPQLVGAPSTFFNDDVIRTVSDLGSCRKSRRPKRLRLPRGGRGRGWKSLVYGNPPVNPLYRDRTRMARPKNHTPVYKLHSSTGLARCWVNGAWVSLGKYAAIPGE